jgi:hypothetical protein
MGSRSASRLASAIAISRRTCATRAENHNPRVGGSSPSSGIAVEAECAASQGVRLAGGGKEQQRSPISVTEWSQAQRDAAALP